MTTRSETTVRGEKVDWVMSLTSAFEFLPSAVQILTVCASVSFYRHMQKGLLHNNVHKKVSTDCAHRSRSFLPVQILKSSDTFGSKGNVWLRENNANAAVCEWKVLPKT